MPESTVARSGGWAEEHEDTPCRNQGRRLAESYNIELAYKGVGLIRARSASMWHTATWRVAEPSPRPSTARCGTQVLSSAASTFAKNIVGTPTFKGDTIYWRSRSKTENNALLARLEYFFCHDICQCTILRAALVINLSCCRTLQQEGFLLPTFRTSVGYAFGSAARFPTLSSRAPFQRA